MKLLVMGGTWFLGRAVVDEAKRRGWEVTTFNRGVSGQDAQGVTAVHGDRTDPDSLAYLAELGPWDAVVDTSASEMPPRVVLDGTRALAGAAGRYVYVSTVSVYQGWPNEALTETSPVLPCPADAGPDYGAMPPGADGPNTHYGTQKAGAEKCHPALRHPAPGPPACHRRRCRVAAGGVRPEPSAAAAGDRAE